MKKITILMLSIFATIASCQKNDTSSQEPPVLPTPILVFDSMSDFMLTADSVSKMSVVELKSFEKTNNFQSFGLLAKEVYNSANFQEFTESDFQEFLDTNEDYVELSEDENGEVSIDPVLSNNMYKYVINKDRMFEVDGNVYKVFKEGVVSVSKDRINELLEMKSSDIISIQGNDKFVYSPFGTAVSTKDMRCSFNTTSMNNDENQKIELVFGNFSSSLSGSVRVYHTIIRATAQKKTFGIWWNVNRTISYNFYIEYTANGVVQVFSSSDVRRAKIIERRIYTGTSFRYIKFHCWAITPSVDHRATIRCNM